MSQALFTRLVHMPAGWASYTEGIRCPRCKG